MVDVDLRLYAVEKPSRWCAATMSCHVERWTQLGAAVSRGSEESLRIRRSKRHKEYVWAVTATVAAPRTVQTDATTSADAPHADVNTTCADEIRVLLWVGGAADRRVT